jgi:hypothetical protein
MQVTGMSVVIMEFRRCQDRYIAIVVRGIPAVLLLARVLARESGHILGPPNHGVVWCYRKVNA